VRAIAAVEAAPPPRTKAPDSDPINRLAFYVAVAEKSPAAAAIKAITERLRALKFPVTQHELAQPRTLESNELQELARWIDTLDRI
jgi:hypothetical protein